MPGLWAINENGVPRLTGPSNTDWVRPSLNLKSNVQIMDGDGTIDNPYRFNGDNDTNLSGTLLKDRYSGEYIHFGNDENNLYRIASHENGTGTKIVSAEPLKNSGSFIESTFGSNTTFSSTNTIGTFLNGEYLTSYVDSEYREMIEESTTWYLGTVGRGTSYKLAKYTDANGTTTTSSTTNAKVGLLRYGELISGQFDIYENTTNYWTLTPYDVSLVHTDYYYYSASNAYGVRPTSVNNSFSFSNYSASNAYGVRPTLNLKSNVVITGGDGTKNNPFTLDLA